MLRRFDPVRNENDFHALCDIALEEFGKFLESVTGRANTGRQEPRVVKRGLPGSRREIWIAGEIDPLSAMGNSELEAAGSALAHREMFSRMLDWYGNEPFPCLSEIMAGASCGFEEAWGNCMKHIDDAASWEEMTAKVAEKEFSVAYHAWMSVSVDPERPANRRIELTSAYYVTSPFLLEGEKANDMRDFSTWLRQYLRGLQSGR